MVSAGGSIMNAKRKAGVVIEEDGENLVTVKFGSVTVTSRLKAKLVRGDQESEQSTRDVAHIFFE
jgi:hypothetical protein